MADTKATTLFTLDAVKAHLTVKGTNMVDDELIARIADGVSDRVASMTGRLFVSQSVVERVDGRGLAELRLRNYPIVSVDSVKRRANLLAAWETLATTEYEADLRLGILYLKTLYFYDGPLGAEVGYTAGYGAKDAATLPSDLVMAALEWVKFAYTRSKNGLLVASSSSMGQTSVITVPRPPKDVEEAILAYKRMRL